MSKANPNGKSLEWIRARLRAAGMRSTAARRAVLQELTGATSPLTHAQVAERLASRGFDRATIYRNLIELAEAGLLSRIELGDHVWRFELRGTDQAAESEHPHFVCVDCGEVACLPQVNVRITPALRRKAIRDRSGDRSFAQRPLRQLHLSERFCQGVPLASNVCQWEAPMDSPTRADVACPCHPMRDIQSTSRESTSMPARAK